MADFGRSTTRRMDGRRRTPIGRVVWWAAGSSVVAAPLLGIAWTPNRDPQFWPTLCAVAVAGLIAGVGWHRRSATPAVARPWAQPPLVVAVAYPFSCAAALIAHAFLHDPPEPGATALWATVAVLFGIVPLVVMRISARADSWLAGLAVFWAVSAVVLVGAYGLGLFFVPLAVANWQAAHSLPLRPAALD